MKQHEAVIIALEKLGGQATLANLYSETMKVEGCEWKAKNPFANIRRIVQATTGDFQSSPWLMGTEVLSEKT